MLETLLVALRIAGLVFLLFVGSTLAVVAYGALFGDPEPLLAIMAMAMLVVVSLVAAAALHSLIEELR